MKIQEKEMLWFQAKASEKLPSSPNPLKKNKALSQSADS
jgi:hypothetical protein